MPDLGSCWRGSVSRQGLIVGRFIKNNGRRSGFAFANAPDPMTEYTRGFWVDRASSDCCGDGSKASTQAPTAPSKANSGHQRFLALREEVDSARIDIRNSLVAHRPPH
jgi:hypothetical protein